MTGKELVMAILCLPMNSRDVSLTEKGFDVIIYRKMMYDHKAGIDALTSSLRRMSIPLRYLFIFGPNDGVLVNNIDELPLVNERLSALSHSVQ